MSGCTSRGSAERILKVIKELYVQEEEMSYSDEEVLK